MSRSIAPGAERHAAGRFQTRWKATGSLPDAIRRALHMRQATRANMRRVLHKGRGRAAPHRFAVTADRPRARHDDQRVGSRDFAISAAA
jgi:hypothetical protein